MDDSERNIDPAELRTGIERLEEECQEYVINQNLLKIDYQQLQKAWTVYQPNFKIIVRKLSN